MHEARTDGDVLGMRRRTPIDRECGKEEQNEAGGG